MAVAVPTWTCRAAGPEGDFLRSAGIDGRRHWVTSSGYMNCVSASGKYLGERPCPELLAKFRALPESERAPGAVRVPDVEPARQLAPQPPPGGLVLRAHARFLARDGGGLRRATTADFPLLAGKSELARAWELFTHPNTECAWLTEAEWRGLVPAEPVVGQTIAAPPGVAQRLARFHLTPRRAVTSEGGVLGPKAVRQAEFSLRVEEATPAAIRFSLAGQVRTGAPFDAALATTPNGPLAFGFETTLEGRLEYDRARRVFTRFDVAAPGEVWGRWGDANGASLPVERPGREPFAFALELAGASPTDRIPPGGNGRYLTEGLGYFGEAK